MVRIREAPAPARHRMLVIFTALALVSAAAISPASSEAFKFLNQKPWPGGRITYFNKARAIDKEVRKAAGIWNQSGVKIRFVRVSSPRRADLIIRQRSHIGCGSGLDTTNQNARHVPYSAVIDIDFSQKQRKQCSPVNVIVLAHEMGHALGLNHENRRCAVMNAINTGLSRNWVGPSHCRTPKGTWYCQVLSPDDLHGARRLYGGRTKLRRRRMCPLPAPVHGGPAPPPDDPVRIKTPGPVGGLTATPSGSATALLRWKLPSRNPPTRLRILRGSSGGRCPAPGGGGASEARAVAAKARRATFEVDGGGTYCFTVVSLRSDGSAGRSVTAKVTLAGIPPDPYFSYDTDYDNPLLVYFYDNSSDSDGQVVAWEWNFGDGSANSTEQNPAHTFPGSGEWTVTLTVRDDRGITATYSTTVYTDSY